MKIEGKKSCIAAKEYFSRQSPFWFDSPLFELKDILETYKNCENSVLYPYVPIRIVALLESYFQHNYALIIDKNTKCRENCKDLLKESIKIDLDVITSIENGQMSFGEYTSLLLPCNSFIDIINNCKILSKDIDIDNPLLNDNIVKEMNNIFKYRHMFCHEGCNYNNLDKTKLISWLDTTITLITQMNGYFFKLVYSDEYDTKQLAIEEFDRVDKELANIINELKEIYRVTECFDNVDYLEDFYEYRSKRAKKEITDYIEGEELNVTAYYWSMTEITKELISGLKRRYKVHLRYFKSLEQN